MKSLALALDTDLEQVSLARVAMHKGYVYMI